MLYERRLWVVLTVSFFLLAIGVWQTVTPGARVAERSVSVGKAKQSGAMPTDKCDPPTKRLALKIDNNYNRQVMSLGPVLYLPLSGSSRNEVDLSGNGHDGVYEPSRAPEQGVVRLPNGDRAASFNGQNQYVQVSSASALSITNTGCLTVQAWVSPRVLQFSRNQGSGYVYILGKGTSGKQEYALRMYSFSNSETPPRPNRVSAYVFNLSGGEGSGAYFQDKIRPNSWMMVTFVVDSRSSRSWPEGYVGIYKDGHPRGPKVSLSQFEVTPRASNAPFRIATRDLGSFFEGAIGKVAIYDTVLSTEQIEATYNAMMSR